MHGASEEQIENCLFLLEALVVSAKSYGQSLRRETHSTELAKIEGREFCFHAFAICSCDASAGMRATSRNTECHISAIVTEKLCSFRQRKIPAPEGDDDLAMGVGVSRQDAQSSRISSELKIYINGMSEPIYINKWI